MAYRTEQEAFWSGEFGEKYIIRNDNGRGVASNIALFSEILSRTEGVKKAIEFGSNIVQNLKALIIRLRNYYGKIPFLEERWKCLKNLS